mmetsp:Transcript_122336/g.273177  ORF Transcript_122336/g.273177 Transcript_122336/m.273177 type:complete len:230 (+) Transcript_122336:527-1216(+)
MAKIFAKMVVLRHLPGRRPHRPFEKRQGTVSHSPECLARGARGRQTLRSPRPFRCSSLHVHGQMGKWLKCPRHLHSWPKKGMVTHVRTEVGSWQSHWDSPDVLVQRPRRWKRRRRRRPAPKLLPRLVSRLAPRLVVLRLAAAALAGSGLGQASCTRCHPVPAVAMAQWARSLHPLPQPQHLPQPHHLPQLRPPPQSRRPQQPRRPPGLRAWVRRPPHTHPPTPPTPCGP